MSNVGEPAESPAHRAGILTPGDAGEALGTSDLAILRLIARGQLPATSLPTRDGKAWKVMTSDLQEYVRKGAPGVADLPSNDGRWYVGDAYSGDRFAELLAALARADIPDGDDMKRLIGSQQAPTPDRAIDMPLAMSANMRKAFYSSAQDKRYRCAGQEFLAGRLRSQAKKIINGGAFSASPIATLYASPTEYSRITSAALDALKKSTAMSFTTVQVLPGRNVAVSFSLPMAALLQLIDQRELVDRAF